jgi:N-acyl amino acid synthase of PEP-CTERM/exosortase system
MSSSRRLRSDCSPAGGRVRPIEIFRRNFTIVQANSKELLDEVFRLRFQVYCQERGFENADAFPDGRERDRDDSRSTHFLVLYRKAKAVEAIPVGTVRLILPRRGTDLPVIRMLQKHDRCRIGLPIESTAEVSRLAVPRAFRRQLQRDLSNQVDRTAAENGARRACTPKFLAGPGGRANDRKLRDHAHRRHDGAGPAAIAASARDRIPPAGPDG